jgi:hypothetical protein
MGQLVAIAIGSHAAVSEVELGLHASGSFESALGFCPAFDELRQFERERRVREEIGSLAERRQRFVEGTAALQAMLQAA